VSADEGNGRRARAPKRGRLPDEEIVARYVARGVGIRALVTESGLAYGTVHRRLRAAGVLRPVGHHAPATKGVEGR
jgi:hypothetical protein